MELLDFLADKQKRSEIKPKKPATQLIRFPSLLVTTHDFRIAIPEWWILPEELPIHFTWNLGNVLMRKKCYDWWFTIKSQQEHTEMNRLAKPQTAKSASNRLDFAAISKTADLDERTHNTYD